MDAWDGEHFYSTRSTGKGGVAIQIKVWLLAIVLLLQHVDPVMARSFSQLAEVAVKKHNLERDSLLVSVYCCAVWLKIFEWQNF